MSGDDILCTIPARPEGSTTLAGNRGVYTRFWNISSANSDDFAAIAGYTNPDSEEILDEFEFLVDNAQDYSVAIMQGVFVAPSDNRYKFFLGADGEAVLNMSTTGLPSDAVSYHCIGFMFHL